MGYELQRALSNGWLIHDPMSREVIDDAQQTRIEELSEAFSVAQIVERFLHRLKCLLYQSLNLLFHVRRGVKGLCVEEKAEFIEPGFICKKVAEKEGGLFQRHGRVGPLCPLLHFRGNPGKALQLDMGKHLLLAFEKAIESALSILSLAADFLNRNGRESFLQKELPANIEQKCLSLLEFPLFSL